MSMDPKAKNGLSSRSFHIQRRKFVRKAYPMLRKENAIDLWYGPKALYGKVNTRHVPQLLSETNLKNILSSPELLAVDFVVDAFEDLRRHISAASRRGVILAQNSFMGIMTAKKAWRSAREQYDEHIRLVYESFSGAYLGYEKNNSKVLNMDSFLESFIKFAREVGKISPITFSSFIKSKYLNHGASGLIIELDDFLYDKDSIKYNRFYKSDHFDFYQNAARKHGFRVDYNCPWRLVADISSPQMLKYMEEYGVNNPVKLFNNYYYDAYKLELAILKKYLVQFYNDFTSGNPIVKKAYGVGSIRPRVKTKLIYRKQLTEKKVNQKYNNLFWLKFYLDIREAELAKPLTRESKNKKIMEMAQIMKGVDFNRALVYINDELMKLERG